MFLFCFFYLSLYFSSPRGQLLEYGGQKLLLPRAEPILFFSGNPIFRFVSTAETFQSFRPKIMCRNNRRIQGTKIKYHYIFIQSRCRFVDKRALDRFFHSS